MRVGDLILEFLTPSVNAPLVLWCQHLIKLEDRVPWRHDPLCEMFMIWIKITSHLVWLIVLYLNRTFGYTIMFIPCFRMVVFCSNFTLGALISKLAPSFAPRWPSFSQRLLIGVFLLTYYPTRVWWQHEYLCEMFVVLDQVISIWLVVKWNLSLLHH
jgi:hypothetical protein